MRLFISIDPPVECRQQISQRIESFSAPDLKPVSGDQLHITLAFIGNQPLATMERIEQTLADLPIPRLTLRCSGVHSFRSGVIWLGVEPDPALLKFQQQLCQRLREIDIALEARKYIPHITLYRRKGSVDADQLQQLNQLFADLRLSFAMDAIWLKESQLHADGAYHQVVAGFH